MCKKLGQTASKVFQDWAFIIIIEGVLSSHRFALLRLSLGHMNFKGANQSPLKGNSSKSINRFKTLISIRKNKDI